MREREEKKTIRLLLNLFMHSSVDSCICPDWICNSSTELPGPGCDAIVKRLGQENSCSLYTVWLYLLYANLKIFCDPWIIQNDTTHVCICICPEGRRKCKIKMTGNRFYFQNSKILVLCLKMNYPHINFKKPCIPLAEANPYHRAKTKTTIILA